MEDENLDGRDLEATKLAHRALMTAYARVADEVSRIRSGREIIMRVGSTGVFRPLPSLVRHFVELHVRRQLRELRAVYTRLQHAPKLGEFSTRNAREWLREAATEVAEFVEVLPRREWLWDVVFAVPALVPASLLAWLLNIHETDPLRWSLLAGVGVVTGVAVVAPFVIVDECFDAKRRLFGAPIGGQRLRGLESVYTREDHLFKLLGRPKRQELALDAITAVVWGLMLVGLGMYSAIVDGFLRGNVAGGVGWLVISAVIAAFAGWVAWRALQRQPR